MPTSIGVRSRASARRSRAADLRRAEGSLDAFRRPIAGRLADVDPDAAHPLEPVSRPLVQRRLAPRPPPTPGAIELPPELTGVPARIVLALGERFPMIRAHKVLAAYGCLVPRVVTGQFDPTRHRAIWPSTGNYCRGGVAISRILGCRGVAVLPESMSRERFDWLEHWVAEPSDIVRTPGTESNVKEIYDECAALDRDPDNIIFNQFCEFGNYLIHYLCTGARSSRCSSRRQASREQARRVRLGDRFGGYDRRRRPPEEPHGARIVAVEAVECPTLLINGFGEHNIQGIGDKHVPLIHNVMNTDVVSASATARPTPFYPLQHRRRPRVSRRTARRRSGAGAELGAFGISGICNIVAAMKLAKYSISGPTTSC